MLLWKLIDIKSHLSLQLSSNHWPGVEVEMKLLLNFTGSLSAEEYIWNWHQDIYGGSCVISVISMLVALTTWGSRESLSMITLKKAGRIWWWRRWWRWQCPPWSRQVEDTRAPWDPRPSSPAHSPAHDHDHDYDSYDQNCNVLKLVNKNQTLYEIPKKYF